MTKLSIITVNLNDKNGLEKTINSVIDQEYRDIEFILIDGGSTDGSKEIIQKYQNHISYWVSEKDNGIYNAMNKGIIAANGDYLLFLNSGDYLINNQTLNDKLFESNLDLIIGGTLIDLVKINSKKVYILNSKITPFFFSRSGMIPHQSTFILKELFSKYGLYNESYKMGGDYEFFMRVIIKYKTNYYILKSIISVYNDLGISSNSKFKTTQSDELKKTIKTHSTFPISLILLTIFYSRQLLRDPLRTIAVRLKLLQIFHKISLIGKKKL